MLYCVWFVKIGRLYYKNSPTIHIGGLKTKNIKTSQYYRSNIAFISRISSAVILI